MDIKATIDEAFSGRSMPQSVLDRPPGQEELYTDERDALWFHLRDWHDLTWDDWLDHYCGMSFLTREAFAYYLPSIMTLSLELRDEPMLAAESVLFLLCRLYSGPAEDPMNGAEFQDLKPPEWRVLKQWLLSLQKQPCYRGSAAAERIDCALEAVSVIGADE